jgi:D-alanyl-D-alanine carboxypeptidase
MASAVFRSVVDRRTYWIAAGSGHHGYFWRNLNPLLGACRGAMGIKTGYTPTAGHCLPECLTTRRGTGIIVWLVNT